MDKKSVSFLALGLLLGVIIASGLFSILSRSGGASGGINKQKIVLKLAHVLDPSHPVHAAMEYMAERAGEKSGGLVEIQVFPSGQLGSETDSIEQVQRGALAMVKTSAAPLEGFIPEMSLFGLPYLFQDEEHYWRALLGDVGKELLATGEDVGLRGLCYYDSGSRSFYTIEEPILSPEDLKGKKIRVMRSKTAMDMISTMGGAPTPIPWGELYTALQQGMVDGAENNPPSVFTSRHFEVTKHYSLDEHTSIPDMVLFSKDIWESLSLQVRNWIQEAADESVTFQREEWKRMTRESLEKLKEAGVEIYHPDKQPFFEKVQPMYEKYEGTEIGEYIERIQKLRG